MGQRAAGDIDPRRSWLFLIPASDLNSEMNLVTIYERTLAFHVRELVQSFRWQRKP